MNPKKYKNIKLVKNLDKANCVTHSGCFHVDDVISTIFLRKILKNVKLIRVPSTENLELKNKIVYDIGLGEFDHHQVNRNGKRKNGIYYSSIGLLWQRFGRNYLADLKIKNIDKTFEYIDNELIQYIDATDNMQFNYLNGKISPDFVKFYNPQWNEKISENEAFLNAIRSADEFWNIYLKHAIAEVEAIDFILSEVQEAKECYLVFEKEIPYRKAVKLINSNVKYFIFKSRREGYDIRIIKDSVRFNNEIVHAKNIAEARKLTKIKDLLYVDFNGKLCCTKTLDSAKMLVKYNEKIL